MSLKFYFSIITVFSIGVPLCASQTIQELEQTTHASQVADKRRINPRLNQKLLGAAKSDDAKKIKELLSAEEIPDVNYRSNDGMTALLWAAYHDNTTVVQALIGAGADVNAANKHGFTVLKWAAWNGNTAIARELIAAGADVDAAKDDGDTALILAVDNGNAEIVQILIDAGADVNAESGRGNTALVWAVDNGKTASIKALLEAGANPMLKNKNNATALMIVEEAIQREPQKEELRKIAKMLQEAENAYMAKRMNLPERALEIGLATTGQNVLPEEVVERVHEYLGVTGVPTHPRAKPSIP